MSDNGSYLDDFAGEGRGGRRGPRFPRFGKGRGPVRPEQPLDYKNLEYLTRLLSPQGKIPSRKRTGFSGQDQRKLAQAVKMARFLALLPFVGKA
jgi:small subunit ribosomal protein S18